SRKEAMYFSRQTIPFQRSAKQSDWINNYTYFKHIGIYGYKVDILKEITKLPVSSYEKAEGLEQLRWLENGYKIKIAETEFDTIAVDHPEDEIGRASCRERVESEIAGGG